MFKSRRIPTVWRIDVEPDEAQPPVGEKPWQGFIATVALVDRLRERLSDRSGRVMHPTWLLRMDPDIERCFGRADFVVRRHVELFDRLIGRADPLGIHVHAYRWDAERSVAFSEYADHSWTTHCLRVAADTFRNAFNEPVRFSSQGGYHLTEPLVDMAVELGIQVDLTVEPGLPPKPADRSFGAYASAPSTDFVKSPRHPYYPSRQAFDVPSSSRADCRPILIVPLTAYDYRTALTPWHRRIAYRFLRRPRRHLPLNPWKVWPSPKSYWDLVARAAREQPACYFAFATRTDDPGSVEHQLVRQLLDYLPNHPIAEQLHFVDPFAPEIQALAIPSKR
jgi:hypothetical protein